MEYQVWHQVEPTFSLRDAEILCAVRTFPRGFMHVANVDCDCLSEVFRCTNHIDHDWRENEVVTWSSKVPARSTSVGDVVITEAGIKFACMPVGWKDETEWNEEVCDAKGCVG